MKVKSINLKDFKRFTNLTIRDIPESAKVVVLVGPNGSGKSSLFEAFNFYLSLAKGTSPHFDSDYHLKNLKDSSTILNWDSLFEQGKVNIDFHGKPNLNWVNFRSNGRKAIYIRSSYRHEADFVVGGLSRMNDMLDDENRPRFMISPDSRVSDNYQRILATSLAEMYDPRCDNLRVADLRERLIGSIRESVSRIFPNLELMSVGDPLRHGTFFFKKGAADHWPYKNLSGGEKAAFDLLLDFIIKVEKFTDSIFCIDEPEVHMHTAVQGTLLQEMIRKLPDDCQLWIATHSIGMMREAKKINDDQPGTVAFLDFSGRDFDQEVGMLPSKTNREFWARNFNVAIGDLADLIAPRQICFCEGSRDSVRANQFDAKCYRTIFAEEFPDVMFVSLGGASEVENNSGLVLSVLKQVIDRIETFNLIDLDDRTTNEIEDARKKGTRVLSLRNLESFLFDSEILQKLCSRNDQMQKWPEIEAAKKRLMSDSVARNKPNDDYKSIRGDLYIEIKRILGLRQCGNRADTFCSDTLAPLVTPETKVYQQLRKDIFEIT